MYPEATHSREFRPLKLKGSEGTWRAHRDFHEPHEGPLDARRPYTGYWWFRLVARWFEPHFFLKLHGEGKPPNHIGVKYVQAKTLSSLRPSGRENSSEANCWSGVCFRLKKRLGGVLEECSRRSVGPCLRPARCRSCLNRNSCLTRSEVRGCTLDCHALSSSLLGRVEK